MTRDELLLGLKDISPPPAPDWWLLAPGYLALGLLGLLLIAGFGFCLRLRRLRRLSRLASRELRHIATAHARHQDSRRLAFELAQWLKRVALLGFPDKRLESLSGSQWLDFLDRSIGDASFTRGEGRIFGNALYRPEVEFSPASAFALCERWLAAIRPRLVERGKI
jgi:hypothetical protein